MQPRKERQELLARPERSRLGLLFIRVVYISNTFHVIRLSGLSINFYLPYLASQSFFHWESSLGTTTNRAIPSRSTCFEC